MEGSHVQVLGRKLEFQNPLNTHKEGLIAVGGDLSPRRLLLAYRMGIFPWTAKPISWWSPDPRAVIPLDNFHIPRRLKQTLRQKKFEIAINQAFTKTIKACAEAKRRDGKTWIAPSFIKAYTALHRLGSAHSFECRIEKKLAAGIYGVAIGGFFAGESMFHTSANAGNIALACLLEHLRKQKFLLFDIQMITPHTQRFGAIEIPRADYLKKLSSAIARPCSFIERPGDAIP